MEHLADIDLDEFTTEILLNSMIRHYYKLRKTFLFAFDYVVSIFRLKDRQNRLSFFWWQQCEIIIYSSKYNSLHYSDNMIYYICKNILSRIIMQKMMNTKETASLRNIRNRQVNKL